MTPMSGSMNMALPKAFQIMPVELNQEIAHNLDEDKDVVSFRASCRRARDSIDDQDSFWHKRFGMIYDHDRRLAYGPGINTSLRKTYQVRKDVLRDGVGFSKGKTKKERNAIAVLIDMIRESFEGDSFDDAHGLTSCGNLKEICSFAKRSNLLDSIFCGRSKMTHNGKVVDFRLNQDLVAIQLMLVPLILNPKDYRRPLNFADSQKVVYSNDGLMTMWKNGTLELNLEWLLHMLNFFKFHMVGDDNTLKDPMSELDSKQMPQFWKRKLTNAPTPLGRRWMGTYAYLDREEMVQLRRGNIDRNLFMDKNVDHGESAIQTLRIDFDGPMDFEWPDLFEEHLESQTLPPLPTHSRVQHRAHTDHDVEASRTTNDGFKSHRFQARGFDDEDFFGTGWVNQLPAQRGIPGWQRITMMKYFKDEEDDGGFDTTALWAYEGVVLPGGQVILGRWWSPEVGVPDDEKYSGPFVFWNVDESEYPLLGVDEQEEENEDEDEDKDEE